MAVIRVLLRRVRGGVLRLGSDWGVDWPILNVLSEEERRALLSIARRRRFARNEVIFHEGDPGDTLHLLAKGHVAIRVATPWGDVATVRVLRAGAFLGELAVVSP